MSGYVLAEFASAHETAEAVRKACEGGHAPEDVLSPVPIVGVAEHLARPRPAKPIGWVMFVAGSLGAAVGYLMQWYGSVFDYPIDSGGRPLNSWPAFLLVPYETAILSAAITGLLGWMAMCGLPKLFHPLFEAGIVARAVQDRYLLVFVRDARLDKWVKEHLEPKAVYEVRE
jgi:hypothetical protein